MKFMIVGKANDETEAGALPGQEYVDQMMEFNESLAKAGVLLAAEGLYPTSEGVQISYTAGKGTVLDGPFAEAKELIAGFWLIQVRSREEAAEWAMRVPVPPGCEGVALQVYRVFDASDSPDWMSPDSVARDTTLRNSL